MVVDGGRAKLGNIMGEGLVPEITQVITSPGDADKLASEVAIVDYVTSLTIAAGKGSWAEVLVLAGVP